MNPPVRAAAGGRVVLAKELVIHGKTIVLDHGQGVISLYIHLSRMDVEKGDRVSKGEEIGAVGQTGLATGPNLHWAVYIHGTPVDPVPWTERIH